MLAVLSAVTAGYDRPSMAAILKRVNEQCRRKRLTPPSRATIYKMLATLPTPRYRVAELPAAVQAALYNLGPDSDVPTHQIAFYCFNYGDVRAMSFAAGLPWLALYQAQRMPGHRPKSRGVLHAVALHRHSLGIAECLAAVRQVYRQDVNDSLLLRALTFFDDAEREAALPGEGRDDWSTVKEFFWSRVGQLLIPPSRQLQIETRVIDVADT